jgi:DNA-binding CsgD family transcriptional regulator
MKLPAEIKTQHKIRDSKICILWARDGLTQEEIGEQFKLTATRIRQILYKNKHLLKIDREYEKLKRLGVLKKMLSKHPETIGKKDTIDIVKAMREETEESKSGSGVSVVVNVMQSVVKDGIPLEYKLGDIVSSRITQNT